MDHEPNWTSKTYIVRHWLLSAHSFTVGSLARCAMNKKKNMNILSELTTLMNYLSVLSTEPPSVDEWTGLIRSLGLCTGILAVKYIISCQLASDSRYHPEEDDKYLAKLPIPSVRMVRQFLNDLENIPIQLLTLWAAFAVQCFVNASGKSGRSETNLLKQVVILYTIARVMFTFCYIRGIQPFRTVSYAVSMLTSLAAIYVIVLGSWKGDFNGVLSKIVSANK